MPQLSMLILTCITHRFYDPMTGTYMDRPYTYGLKTEFLHQLFQFALW